MNADMTFEDLVKMGRDMNFHLSPEDVKFIEKQSENQANSPDWFMYRTGRIIASLMKEVCSIRSFDSKYAIQLSRNLRQVRLNKGKKMKTRQELSTYPLSSTTISRC